MLMAGSNAVREGMAGVQNYGTCPASLVEKTRSRWMDEVKKKIREKCTCSRGCWTQWILSFFPFAQWMREYDWKKDFISDFIAGLTVGIMSIPQGISYAGVAGVPAVYGLYSNLIPTMLYFFVGSARLAAIGPPAVLCIMLGNSRYKSISDSQSDLSEGCFPALFGNSNSTFEMDPRNLTGHDHHLKYTEDMGTEIFERPDCFTSWQLVISLTMLTGLILVLMGMLHLGFLSTYLSDHMVGGFTSGAAVHVMTSQLDYVSGTHLPWHTGVGKLIFNYMDLITHMQEAIPATVGLSCVCIIVLMVIKELVNPKFQRALGIPFPGELLLIIIGTIISHFGQLERKYSIEVVHSITAGFPRPTVPRFDLMKRVALDAVVLAIVLYALSMSLGKLYAKRNGYKIDANQEFFAYGLINVVGSIFQSFASGQVVSRSIVYESSGARSQFAGMFGAILVLITILWIAPLLSALPKAILGSIIVVSCIQMLKQLKQLNALYMDSKADFSVYLFTFLAVLFLDVVEGLVASIAFAILLASLSCLWRQIRKRSWKVEQAPRIKIFRFDEPLDFNSSARFQRLLYEFCGLNPDQILAKEQGFELSVIASSIAEVAAAEELAIILDCSSIHYIDSKGVRTLKEVDDELKNHSISLYFAECTGDNLETLRLANFFTRDRAERTYDTIQDALRKIPS